jgi:hypothetical protein
VVIQNSLKMASDIPGKESFKYLDVITAQRRSLPRKT